MLVGCDIQMFVFANSLNQTSSGYPPKKYEIPYILRLFSKVGTISVWRPTSNDAIKYMMTGEGVSKSCDVP